MRWIVAWDTHLQNMPPVIQSRWWRLIDGASKRGNDMPSIPQSRNGKMKKLFKVKCKRRAGGGGAGGGKVQMERD